MYSKKYFLRILSLAILCSFVLPAFASDPIVIETQQTSMVFSVTDDNKVFYHYYGEKLNGYENFKYTNYLNQPDTDNAFGAEIYPAYGGRMFLEPALQITHEDGVLTTDLIYDSHNVKRISDNLIQTDIILKDKIYPLEVQLVFEAYQKENIISQHAIVLNKSRKTIDLNKMYSSYLPLQEYAYYLSHFHGTWANEMQMVEEKLEAGVKVIESKKGVRTTQSSNPSFLISVNQPAQENLGEVYAGVLSWSGNYKLSFEIDESGRLNILSGINPFLSTYKLKKNQKFFTPKMNLSYSNEGKGQISRNFHDWARSYSMYHGKDLRPIVLNSWEGAYFNYDEETILEMIDKAAEFGIEMFVLDDGWFGDEYPRNGDNAGLGDWVVNYKKLPNGIDNLAKYATSKGLQFGIWIEPEMVNPDSKLAKTKPQWVVKSGKRDMLTMRNQNLLDLTNPEVQDYIVKVFDDVVSLSSDISFVKWDANRHVDNVGSDYLSRKDQTQFWVDYTLGLYSVYERIREKHPDIIIQQCSAGGGRVDFGALYYHDEFWASDNTDALSRIFIQYGTSMFFPANSMGAHVSTSPNHQTGLITPLKFRFDVAMSGRLGMELQPKDLKGDDIEFTKQAIQHYKDIRPIVQQGDLYRLLSPYSNTGWSSHMFVSKDKSQAVLFTYSLKYHNRTMSFKTVLNGLEKNASYKIKEINNLWSSVIDKTDIFTGDYLMNHGLNLDIKNPNSSAVIILDKIK